jgi:hypothetical protein
MVNLKVTASNFIYSLSTNNLTTTIGGTDIVRIILNTVETVVI